MTYKIQRVGRQSLAVIDAARVDMGTLGGTFNVGQTVFGVAFPDTTVRTRTAAYSLQATTPTITANNQFGFACCVNGLLPQQSTRQTDDEAITVQCNASLRAYNSSGGDVVGIPFVGQLAGSAPVAFGTGVETITNFHCIPHHQQGGDFAGIISVNETVNIGNHNANASANANPIVFGIMFQNASGSNLAYTVVGSMSLYKYDREIPTHDPENH